MSRFGLATTVTLGVLVAAAAALSVEAWDAPGANTLADRTALVTAVLTGATLLLAVLAALVALVACEVSARRPDLRPLMVFEMPVAANTLKVTPMSVSMRPG